MKTARLIICAFVIAGSVAICPKSLAKTYYVDQRNPKASDTNPGTELLPWSTIKAAAERAVAGDTVFVKTGIYREAVEVKNSGAEGNMIVFKAVGDSVIVKGSDVVAGWAAWKGDVWKKEGWSVNSQQVFIDGKILTQIGGNPWYSPKRLPAVGNGTKDLIPGSFFYDNAAHALYVRPSDQTDLNKRLVEVSMRPYIWLVTQKRYIVVSGFKFQHSNTTAAYRDGWPAVNIGGSHCVVENNEVTWCDFAGLGGHGDTELVRGNIADHNGDCGMTFSGRNVTMENNRTNYNNYRGFNVDWHAGGVKNVPIANSSISHHVSVGNNGPGIWFDNCDSISIFSCDVHENTNVGMFFEISRGGIIANNIVYANKNSGIYVSASKGCLVANNLVMKNGRGIVLHGIPRAGNSLMNNRAENNILCDNGEADLVIAHPGSDCQGNTSDYNLFFPSQGSPKMKYGWDKAINSIAGWHELSQQDAHSVQGDPQFVNEGAFDFHLKPTSPAVGKGIAEKTVAVDFDGTSRNTGRNDIGPYQAH